MSQVQEVIESLRHKVARFPEQADQETGFPISVGDAKVILAELDRLRRLAGAVSHGESFGEIKELARKSGPAPDQA